MVDGSRVAFDRRVHLGADDARPRIKDVKFDPVVRTTPAGSGTAIQYVTKMKVSFEPIDPPLFLRIKVHYKNRTGEGTHEERPIELSSWSKGGSITNNRVFQLPG